MSALSATEGYSSFPLIPEAYMGTASDAATAQSAPTRIMESKPNSCSNQFKPRLPSPLRPPSEKIMEPKLKLKILSPEEIDEAKNRLGNKGVDKKYFNVALGTAALILTVTLASFAVFPIVFGLIGLVSLFCVVVNIYQIKQTNKELDELEQQEQAQFNLPS